MTKIRTLIEIIVFLILLFVLVAFALSNQHTIEFDFLVARVEWHLGITLLLVFGIGALFGFLMRLPSSLALRSRAVKAERQIKKINQSNAA